MPDLAKLPMALLLGLGFLGAGLTSGCGVVAAATGGAVAGTELAEDDETFDPLEDTEVYEEVDEAIE